MVDLEDVQATFPRQDSSRIPQDVAKAAACTSWWNNICPRGLSKVLLYHAVEAGDCVVTDGAWLQSC